MKGEEFQARFPEIDKLSAAHNVGEVGASFLAVEGACGNFISRTLATVTLASRILLDAATVSPIIALPDICAGFILSSCSRTQFDGTVAASAMAAICHDTRIER